MWHLGPWLRGDYGGVGVDLMILKASSCLDDSVRPLSKWPVPVPPYGNWWEALILLSPTIMRTHVFLASC